MACHYYPPHVGGIEVVAHAQAKTMAEHGIEVEVLTSRAGPDVPATSPAGVELRCLPASNFLERRLGIPFPLFGLRYAWAAWRAVGRADGVHIHDVFYLSSQLLGGVAILRGRPLFVTQHVAIVDHPSRWVVLLQRIAYATIGTLLFRQARAIVVYNGNVRRTVEQYGGRGKVLEVRNGIDTAFFSPCSPEEKKALRAKHGLTDGRPIALFVGRLVAKKGYEQLFAARDPRYLTVFVGDGAAATGVIGDADSRFVGALDRTELVDYYRMSDVFVLPSEGELFTLGMQEAMACGLPVITSNDPGYAEYDFDRNAIKLTDRRPAALRAAILETLFGASSGDAGGYCRSFAVEHFSWTRNVSAVLDLYAAIPSSSG